MGDTLGGLKISSSPLVQPGCFIWFRGSECVGIHTKQRADFLGMFGLMPEPPAGVTGVVMSEDDYLVVVSKATKDQPTDA